MAVQSRMADPLTQSSRDFIETLNLSGSPPGQGDLDVLSGQVQRLTGKSPRPGQVLALHHLLYGKQDTLLQAATGYGKSMIWQCAPLIGAGIALMVSPLNMLTEDQVILLPRGSKGISLTAENNTTEAYKDIAAGNYTHGMPISYVFRSRLCIIQSACVVNTGGPDAFGPPVFITYYLLTSICLGWQPADHYQCVCLLKSRVPGGLRNMSFKTSIFVRRICTS